MATRGLPHTDAPPDPALTHRAGQVTGGSGHLTHRAEFFYALLIVIVFFAVSLATSTRFPLPWQDEDMFTDVAASFAFGQGFVSSVWTCGNDDLDKFFACNAPLFPYLLGLWIRVFGFTIRSVRSLNYLFISASVVFLWWGVRRLNLIARPGRRLLLLPLVLTGYGVGINYRSARYDCLGILIVCGIFLAHSIPRARLRYGVLAALGALLPLAGVQLVCFTAIVGLLLLAYLGGRILKDLIAIGVGGVMGGLVLVGIFVDHGVLKDFLLSLHGESSMSQGYSGYGTQRLPKDPSLFLFYAAVLVLGLGELRRRQFKSRSLLGFALVAGVTVPVGMFLLGKFPTYYSWMAYIPVVVALCAALSTMSFRSRPVAAVVVTLCVVFGSLTGAPLQMASALYYWHDRESAPVDALVARNVGPTDWVYTDYAAYFSVRRHTRYVFIPFVIPSQYRDKITVMVLTPGDFENFAKAIVGGEWIDTGDAISSTGHDLIQRSFAILLERRNDLKVYKRAALQNRGVTVTLDNDTAE